MDNKLTQYNAERDFGQFFDNKCYVVSLSEKSVSNYYYICRNKTNLKWRLHHFAVGHRFKSLPVSSSIIFQNTYDEGTKKHRCLDFQKLQIENFNFRDYLSTAEKEDDIEDALRDIIKTLRNLNNHYIHTFDNLRIEKSSPIALFLKDAFRMATTMIFLENKDVEKNETKWEEWKREFYKEYPKKDYTSEQFDEQLRKKYTNYISKNFEKDYVNFLKQKFYPFDEEKELSEEEYKRAKSYIDLRNAFGEQSVYECIDSLLFTEVSEAIDWKLYGEHQIMTIKQGTYLSFTGSLFLLSMFLYKDEANQLISKVKGYKRNDDDQMRSKRNIMSFFAKKRSSQDYDSEERGLIYARDIIQYLNKYPTAWNREIDLDNESEPGIATELKKKIEELEIDRLFPEMADNKDFKQYAIARIFRNESLEPPKPIYKDCIEKNSEVKAIYDIIATNKFEKQDYKAVEKLRKRLRDKTFYTSYGRNQDRFMEIAVCYLAATKYFGENARFKMYQFYTTDEQNKYLEEPKQQRLPQEKEYDAQNFHGGRLTHYCTYAEHHERYPEWDTSFVEENNAIQVKLSLVEGKDTIVSIQRPLLVYLLQDALFAPEANRIGGDTLLKHYFVGAYEADLQVMKSAFDDKKRDKTTLAQMRKLLPRRAVKKQLSDKPMMQTLDAYRKILEQAQEREERYGKLLEYKKKTSPEAYENFIRNNKGKQFKLQFVRKAWHIMYFRNIYKVAAPTQKDHHKSLHITRDEFNDFCRYMFAMDTVSDYKECLRNLLESKNFFTNKEFKTLFESGKSLEDYYKKTKKEFTKWIDNQQQQPIDDRKFQLDGYKNFSGNHILYINLSHFLEFLKKKNRLLLHEGKGIELPALANKEYLIADYYYNIACTKDTDKAQRKVLNTLKPYRLEDCLLYEIAIRYFTANGVDGSNVKNSVRKILTDRYEFSVKDKNNNHLYSIQVPFKQIERYVGINNYYKEKEKRGHQNFLVELPGYISLLEKKYKRLDDQKSSLSNSKNRPVKKKKLSKQEEAIRQYTTNKIITLEDLHQIQAEIVTESGKFLSVYMELEKYFVAKNELTIKENNRITFSEITPLSSFLKAQERNTACHFGVPKELYERKLKRVEKQFVEQYISATCAGYNGIGKHERAVTDKLLKSLHNSFFNHREKDATKRKEEAEEQYFEKVVKKNRTQNKK